MSTQVRRMNVASSHGAEAGMPTARSFLNTKSSMKFRAGGNCATGAPSGMVARKTATLDW